MFALGRSPNIVREPAEEQVRKSVQSFLPLSSSSNPLLAPDDAETRRTTPHTPATFRVVARLGRNFICQCHATSGAIHRATDPLFHHFPRRPLLLWQKDEALRCEFGAANERARHEMWFSCSLFPLVLDNEIPKTLDGTKAQL